MTSSQPRPWIPVMTSCPRGHDSGWQVWYASYIAQKNSNSKINWKSTKFENHFPHELDQKNSKLWKSTKFENHFQHEVELSKLKFSKSSKLWKSTKTRSFQEKLKFENQLNFENQLKHEVFMKNSIRKSTKFENQLQNSC